MKRRTLLNSALAGGPISLLATQTGIAAAETEKEATPFRTIDTNVSLFRWPFRRLPLDEPENLVGKLRSLGIGRALAGSFEGILHRDLAGVNRRLADVCAKYPELDPIGVINPELPDWENDLRSCVEVHHMRGIRLFPNYHGYTLESPGFFRLLDLAENSGLFVQIASVLEDSRTQHPMLRIPEVDLEPLTGVMGKFPELIVQILNWRPRQPLLDKLAATGGIGFDTARVESTDGVATLLRAVPPGRVMFGSHSPFLIPEAAMIRVHESDLKTDELRSLLQGNAEWLLGDRAK